MANTDVTSVSTATRYFNIIYPIYLAEWAGSGNVIFLKVPSGV